MGSRFMVFGAAGLWLALFIISFIAFNSVDATSDGFTRGMDRAETLLAWQGGAMAAAALALIAAVRLKPPRGAPVTLAGFMPMALMILELIALVALIICLATRDPSKRIERFLYPGGTALHGIN